MMKTPDWTKFSAGWKSLLNNPAANGLWAGGAAMFSAIGGYLEKLSWTEICVLSLAVFYLILVLLERGRKFFAQESSTSLAQSSAVRLLDDDNSRLRQYPTAIKGLYGFCSRIDRMLDKDKLKKAEVDAFVNELNEHIPSGFGTAKHKEWLKCTNHLIALDSAKSDQLIQHLRTHREFLIKWTEEYQSEWMELANRKCKELGFEPMI